MTGEQTSMKMGEIKLPTIQKTTASKEAKGSKNNFDVEYVFDTFAERYDKWYDKPFGKTAFNLEKECVESLCKNLERLFLEIGVGTGRFAVALKGEYGIDKSVEAISDVPLFHDFYNSILALLCVQ